MRNLMLNRAIGVITVLMMALAAGAALFTLGLVAAQALLR